MYRNIDLNKIIIFAILLLFWCHICIKVDRDAQERISINGKRVK